MTLTVGASPTVIALKKNLNNDQNHAWGQHALSISPILVIDDNPLYEGLYNEFKRTAREQTQISLNPLNFSPISIDCRNGKKNLKGQYNMSSSPKCAFLKI